jgi:carbon storage regulator
MLILTRKIGQSIIIGGDIKIKLLDVKGDSIRIGIEAPKEVEIYREELFDKIQSENNSNESDNE